MKKIIVCGILAVLFCGMFLFTDVSAEEANADFGPKPTTTVNFKNMGEEDCFGTLLSKTSSTGPFSSWEVLNNYVDEDYFENLYNESENKEVLEAFLNYEDADGYYFLLYNRIWHCSQTKNIFWGYYPPQDFKILLYYPQKDKFVVSEPCSRYAFESCFTVNMSGMDIENTTQNEDIDNTTQNDVLSVKKDYNIGKTILQLLGRVVITLAIELFVALIFRMCRGRKLKAIIITNIFTNLTLNIALSVLNYFSGILAFAIVYALSEFFVLIIESIVYCIQFRKEDKKPSIILILLYTFVANLASFAASFAFAMVLG